MSSFASAFRDCGTPAFVIVFLTIVSVMALIAAAVAVIGSKKRTTGVILSSAAVILAFAVFGAGEFGAWLGRLRTNQAVSGEWEEVSQKEMIRAEGYREAAQCVPLGVGGSALPLLFGLVLLSASLLKKAEDA